MAKVFNTNLTFKLLGLVYGDYNAKNGKFENSNLKSSLLYVYSKFLLALGIYDLIRYVTLAILPKDPGIGYEFYLCDFCSPINGKPYKLMLLAGPIFNGLLIQYYQIKLLIF